MIRILKTLGIMLFCWTLSIDTVFAEKTQVIIVGTIHSAHYKNSKYSPDILKEIILSLKPDAILNELPLIQVEPNGRPLFRDRQKHPEGWAADTVATQLGIRQIPFDRPDRQENFKKTEYFKRQEENNKKGNRLFEKLSSEDPNNVDLKIFSLLVYAQMIESDLFSEAPNIINSQIHDNIIRLKKALSEEIFPELMQKYPDYQSLVDDTHFFKEQWQERNKIMADNIVKAAKEYPGKRLVVVTGATHRYILRDLLKDVNSIDLKEYWEITSPACKTENQAKTDKK